MSAPESVKILLTVILLPSAIVRVAEVEGAVIKSLLIDVALATPKLGVTKDGLLAKTKLPLPVSSVITLRNSALVVADKLLKLFAVYKTVPPAPKLIVLASTPLNVNVFCMFNVLLSAIVKVAVVGTELMVTRLIETAFAAPKLGVTKDGLSAKTKLPLPVSSVNNVFSSRLVVGEN